MQPAYTRSGRQELYDELVAVFSGLLLRMIMFRVVRFFLGVCVSEITRLFSIRTCLVFISQVAGVVTSFDGRVGDNCAHRQY